MGENSVEEIKNRLDIVSVISSYIELKKGGKNYKATCPFHGEKTPSFMVSPELGVYKCFGCGKAGDIFSFVMDFEHIDFRDALETLAKKAGVRLEKLPPGQEKTRKEKILEANSYAADFYNYLLTKHKFGEIARKYLENRKITQTTIDTFQLGYSPRSWESLGNYLVKKGFSIPDIVASGLVRPKTTGRGFFDMFRGRLMFPLKDTRGRIIGFSGRTLFNEEPKYINTQETEVFKKEAFLFGLNVAKDTIKKKGFAVVVEGEFDMISPFQYGVTNIVASKGTSLTRHQIGLLKNICDTVTIFFDTDTAGMAAALRGIEIAEGEGVVVKIGILPKEYKDPDEAVNKNKKEFFASIKNALGVYDYFLERAKTDFDLSSSVGKMKAGDFVVPKIAGIENPIEKEHYIKKLADLLESSQNSVLDLIKMYENKKKLGLKNTTMSEVAPLSTKLDLESYFLAVLFQTSLDVMKKALLEMVSEDFSDISLKEIFIKLKSYLENNSGQFSIEKFTKNLPDDIREKAQNLYLSGVLDDSFDTDAVAKIVIELVSRIKKKSVKVEMSELSGKIKRLEKEGISGEDLEKSSKEYSKLSAKLAEFKD